MKRIIKNNIKLLIGLIIGILITSSIGVIAYTLNAKDVSYTPRDKTWNVKNVEEALDDIKTKGLNKKICTLVSGNPLEIGSKYECNPSGDKTTKYNFYILKVNNNSVKLIMERNISDFVGSSKTMNWQTAMNYFRNGEGTSLNWIVPVELPRAQDIADAVGNTGWNEANKDSSGWFCLETLKQDYPNSSPWCGNQSSKNYLFDYTYNCSSYGCNNSLNASYASGYWTGDAVNKNSSSLTLAWRVPYGAHMGANDITATDCGVRPVIILYKSNLS